MIPGLKFELNLNKILAAAGFLALAFVITFFVWWQRDVTITNDTESDIIVDGLQKSLITGLPCENFNRRPLAVMLASDPVRFRVLAKLILFLKCRLPPTE